MGESKRLFSLLRLGLLLCVVPAAAFSAEGLYVKGNKIFYGGREVYLQGVAVGDPLIARTGRPLSDYSLIAQDWNANVVRISIHPGTWRDYGRRAVLDALRRNVNAALQSGMFVIIAWHAIGVPDAYSQMSPPDTIADLYDTDFRLAKDFWRYVSREFGWDGRIMFELWNEPVWPLMPDGSQNYPKWQELKPYWERLIEVVRNYSGNLIILASNGWGYNLQGVRGNFLADANVAYAWHVYAGTDGNDPAAWERNLDGLQEIRPVFVTEWGFEPDSPNPAYHGNAERYGYLFADRFLRDKRLHHTAWCWHPTWMPRMFREDWLHLTAFGEFVKMVLWRKNFPPLIRP